MTVFLLTIFLSSLGLCLVLTPLARSLASRWGLVDWPDGRRKMHAQATPVAGGIAILVSAAVALSVGLYFYRDTLDALSLQPPVSSLWGLLLAALVICLVGVIDDYRGLRGRHKLLGQMAAVVVALCCGVVVKRISLFDYDIELGLLAWPCTALWLLGAINSLNLIDGMDGLLGCVGLIICLALAGLACWGGNLVTACVALALAGALLGFLRYNFPPATIFLGDAGSMLIGLVVGILAIQTSLKGPATIALAAPTALLVIPFFDTFAAIVRRKMTGRSLYTTDRGHLHHRLLARGFSSWVVLMVISACCGLTVLGVLLGVALKNEWIALVAASTVVLLLVVTGLFGRAELLLVQKRCGGLVHSLWRRYPDGRGKELEVRLEGSADWHREIWEPLLECAVQLQLKTVHFNVNAPAIHEGWHGEWSCTEALSGDEMALWRAHVPILVAERVVGSLEIAGWQGPEPVWEKIKVLGVVLQKVEALILDLSTSGHPTTAAGHDRFHSPGLAVPHHAQAFGPSPEEATSARHSAEDHCPVTARPQTNGAIS